MMLFSVLQSPRFAGNTPEKLLLNTTMSNSFLLKQRVSGGSPERWLSATSKFPNFECFPRSGGRGPESLLLNSRTSASFGSRPTLAGIGSVERDEKVSDSLDCVSLLVVFGTVASPAIQRHSDIQSATEIVFDLNLSLPLLSVNCNLIPSTK